MPIPTYESWKTRTERGFFTPRSKQLKAIDEALKTYNKVKSEPNKAALKDKLDKWIAYKGAGWKTSTRNTDHVVEELLQALNPYRVAPTGWTAPPLPTDPQAGSTYLGASFACSNSLARAQVPVAIDRARALINVAYLGLNQARAAGVHRQVYERWFGTYDATRFQTVAGNIRALYDALFLKPVLLYYRGDGATGATDCAVENGNITPGSYFGAAWKASNLPVGLDPKYTHIFVGRLFFTSGVYSKDSTGGVIIHELSHAICSTDDVIYDGATTYGVTRCKELATERPDLAVTNADNYEYMCENYQTKLFVPKEKTLNLPVKATIVLDLRPPT